MTCAVELLQSGLDLLLELLSGEDEAVLKFLFVLLQHDVTVNQHLLEPHPLPIQHFTHILHLRVIMMRRNILSVCLCVDIQYP